MPAGKRVRRAEFKKRCQACGVWEKFLTARAELYAKAWTPQQVRELLYPEFERLMDEFEKAQQKDGGAQALQKRKAAKAPARKKDSTEKGPGKAKAPLKRKA
jgi:hypothetical protein